MLKLLADAVFNAFCEKKLSSFTFFVKKSKICQKHLLTQVNILSIRLHIYKQKGKKIEQKNLNVNSANSISNVATMILSMNSTKFNKTTKNIV